MYVGVAEVGANAIAAVLFAYPVQSAGHQVKSFVPLHFLPAVRGAPYRFAQALRVFVEVLEGDGLGGQGVGQGVSEIFSGNSGVTLAVIAGMGTMSFLQWRSSVERVSLLEREADVATSEERLNAYRANLGEVTQDLEKRQDFIEEMMKVVPADAIQESTVTDSSDETADMVEKVSMAVPEAAALAKIEARQLVFVEGLTRYADNRSKQAMWALNELGLDPKQIIEIREVIKSLRGEHTIVLSTHILPEVSMTCEKVVIISQGRIVGEGSPESLTAQLKESDVLHAQVLGPVEAVGEALRSIDGVLDARQEGDDSQADSWVISVTPGQDVRDAVSRAIIDGGFSLRELRSQDMSLEDIFLRLTTEETTV